MNVLRDLQPHGGAEATSQELLLQSLEEVLRIVLFDLDVLIASDAEGRVVDDLHPLEESVEVFGDDVLERNEAGGDIAADGAVRGRGDIEEPGQARGTLTRAKSTLPESG